jgi:hypothetical protein
MLIRKFLGCVALMVILTTAIGKSHPETFTYNESETHRRNLVSFILPVNIGGLPGYNDTTIITGDTISYTNLTTINENIVQYMQNNTLTERQLTVFTLTLELVISKQKI